VAEPARRTVGDNPPLDPTAVERAYRLERAKRRARLDHARAKRLARLRFVAVLVLLLSLAIVVGLTAWHEIQAVFGL
jgi:thiosulfate reductase cytochrome b subunit